MFSFNLILFFILLGSSAPKHSISKRALLFPRASVVQFTYGITAPAILPSRSINLSLCMQVNYNLPYNISLLTPATVAKSNNDFDLSRQMFYKFIVRFLDSFGLHGPHCLLRMICEISEYPMHLDHRENLLEKIVHFVFTPSLEFVQNNSTRSFANKLLKAENLGQHKGECDKTYSKCPISLVDLFTSKYII